MNQQAKAKVRTMILTIAIGIMVLSRFLTSPTYQSARMVDAISLFAAGLMFGVALVKGIDLARANRADP